jgi:hypothetical protein
MGIGTGKAVLLFITGLLIMLFAFPIFVGVSAGLGYVFIIITIGLAIYLIAKHDDKKVPLVLGIVLLVIGVFVIIGMAFIHATLMSFEESVGEMTESRVMSARFREAVKLGEWEVAVINVRAANYISKDDSYYVADEGYKYVIVTLRVRNVGEASSSLSFYNFLLVTNADKSYEATYTSYSNEIEDVSEEIKSISMPLNELQLYKSLAPSTYIEGDILFQIPIHESPRRLHFKTGIVGGYEAALDLITQEEKITTIATRTTRKVYHIGEEIKFDSFTFVVKDVRVVDSYVTRNEPWSDEWYIVKIRRPFAAVIISVYIYNSDIKRQYNPIGNERIITSSGHEVQFGGTECYGLSWDYIDNMTLTQSKEPPLNYYVVGVTEKCDPHHYDLMPESSSEYVYFFLIREGDTPELFKFEVYGKEITVDLKK